MEDVRVRLPRSIGVAFGPGLETSLGDALGADEIVRAAPDHLLRVEVTSVRDQRPIDDADVRVDGTSLLWSLSEGAFIYRYSAAVPHKLRVRRLGFRPEERLLSLVEGGMTVRLELHPISTLLPEMVIGGRRIRLDVRYSSVALRAQSGWGEVFTRDDLRGAYDMQSLLESIPGVRVQADRIRFARCQDQLPGTGTPAKVQVYVDGVRVTTSADVPDVQAIRSISPAAVELVEVYRGVSRIPGEFLNDACAVIAIWTRPP